jgi:hypothetical protein
MPSLYECSDMNLGVFSTRYTKNTRKNKKINPPAEVVYLPRGHLILRAKS